MNQDKYRVNVMNRLPETKKESGQEKTKTKNASRKRKHKQYESSDSSSDSDSEDIDVHSALSSDSEMLNPSQVLQRK